MLRDDFDNFSTVMRDLCAAFDKPPTDDRTRVFWETLKHVHLHDVKRAAESWKRNQRKFPSPRDLMPERVSAPPPKPVDDGPRMSSWAIAANKILFSVAYQGNRGFRPIAQWQGEECVSDLTLKRCLQIKADYVRMAEEAAVSGDVWEPQDFNRMCREGFQKLLGTSA